MTEEERKIELLLSTYPLGLLLLQNDIEEHTVLKLLVREGLFDFDEYFYRDTQEAIWEDN